AATDSLQEADGARRRWPLTLDPRIELLREASMLVGKLVPQRLRRHCSRDDFAQRRERPRKIAVLSRIDPQVLHGIFPFGHVEAAGVFVEQLQRRMNAAYPQGWTHDGCT